MKKLILIASIFVACLTISQTAKADNWGRLSAQETSARPIKNTGTGFYFGGGYQLTNLSFQEPEPRGSTTSIFTRPALDEDGVVILDDEDNVVEEEYEITHPAAYLDQKDYYSNSFSNFNVFTGYILTDLASLELGFMYQQDDKANNNSNEFIYDGKTAESTSTLAIASIDMVFSSLLIEDIANLNIIVGASAVSFKTELDLYDDGVYSNSISESNLDFGINIGVGIETKLSKRLWLRTSVKAIILPESDVIESIFITNVGLKIIL